MWRRINLILAVVVLALAIGAGAKFGFSYWSAQHIQPEKTVIGTPSLPTRPPKSPKLQIEAFHYYYGRDFLNRPTLVVSYAMHNKGTVAALPQYVFDNTVTFVQQTDAGTNSILAETTMPGKRLSFLNQNYQENGQIQLKADQSARVLALFRLESRNRPVTLLVDGKQRLSIQPWTLKAVAANE